MFAWFQSAEKRKYHEVFEYLGWCSWDAMEIRVSEEDLIKKCEEFAVYEHFSRDFYVLKRNEKISVTLENSDHFKLFVIVPLKDGNCVIGRTDKYISPATVRPGEAKPFEPGPYAYVKNRKIYFAE